jgi:hypothetical protein
MLIGDLPSRQGAAGLPSGYVRFGSKADICAAKGHVRFTPKSGHLQCKRPCPLRAKSRHRPTRSPGQVLILLVNLLHLHFIHTATVHCDFRELRFYLAQIRGRQLNVNRS